MTNGATMTALPARLAVADISAARIPGQFRMTIEADRQWVRHQVVAWSVGLRWLTFEFYDIVHNAASALFVDGRDDEYLETVEAPLMEKWMGGHCHDHVVAHQAALMHGLLPGGANDLPVERILMDRLLKEMVEAEGIDVHGPVETIANNDNYTQFLANCSKYMGTYVNDRHFQLRRLGHGLPMLSTDMPLGSASYCGHALDLGHQLPETISVGLVGRRLGDLVATGIAKLDARVVTGVVTPPTCEDHWPADAETRLYLEPDLVELGS